MKRTGFFAYPSKTTAYAFTIDRAIKFINSNSSEIEVTGWEENSYKGEFILDKVTNSINEADVFICDLTYINANVLFELGYAIISDKPIWVCVDKGVHDKERFRKELGLLSTFEYRAYHSGDQLGTFFLEDAPFRDLEATLFRTHVDPLLKTTLDKPGILYLKSSISTDTSNELTKRLNRSNLSIRTDDVHEVKRRPFDWYVEKLYQSIGVIAHLLDDERDLNSPQNAKYAFVCGMAYAAGTPLLMLAHSPYNAPIDFRDLVVEHDTPSQCIETFDEWLRINNDTFERRISQHIEHQRKIKGSHELRNIDIGEYVAEDEEQSLQEYFISTSAYEEALRGNRYTLFVGRKGTGKTANLFQIERELKKQKSQDYIICVIKPEDIQIEDIFRLVRIGLEKADQSYLVEALWKFLIYTEIAQKVYDIIHLNHPSLWDKDEKNFCDFINTTGDLIKSDFTVRMERAIEEICGIDTTQRGSRQKGNISEILHADLLNTLRIQLGKTVKNKKKVFVLIDNLDKAWEKRDDLTALSQFIFGLLKVGETITQQFQKNSSLHYPIDVKLITFLRSDIFSVIAPDARERDRLKYIYINWNDRRLLEQVIEERFIRSQKHPIYPEEIWDKFFCETVKDIPTKEYIFQHIIPRPRDIIFFCKQARANAINHRHARIEESDILLAEKEYSKYCCASLLDETKAQFPDMENLLTALAGSKEIITRDYIRQNLEDALIHSSKLKDAIQLLCDVTFLGLETTLGNFEFIYDERDRDVFARRSERVAKSSGQIRYKINLPYHDYLGIQRIET